MITEMVTSAITHCGEDRLQYGLKPRAIDVVVWHQLHQCQQSEEAAVSMLLGAACQHLTQV